jgi:hypothetical protein
MHYIAAASDTWNRDESTDNCGQKPWNSGYMSRSEENGNLQGTFDLEANSLHLDEI